MAKKYDLVVATGSYQKDGQEKTQWLNVGKILETQAGKMVIKLDCTPTSVIDRDGNNVAWDGWIQMFEAKPREQQQSQPAQPESTGNGAGEGFDSIPF